MKRPRLTAFCVFLMLMLFGSSIVFSQSVDDAFKEYLQGFGKEFSSSRTPERWAEYAQFADPIETETHKNIQDRIDQRKSVLGENPSLEEREKYFIDTIFDLHSVKQKILDDKAKELFPNTQVMEQRKFQLHESLMRRLELHDNAEDIVFTSGMVSVPTNIFNIQPDFLELSPEQIELMKSIQKETALKIRLLNAPTERIEILREMGQLSRKHTEAQTPEEKREIELLMKKLTMDRVKDILPQLKEAVLEGRESYMRVLTDTQKAKIKSVMDDMPDYPNPMREAPRQRTNTGGGRAFGD